MAYWVYVLRCGDGSLYTGTAANVQKRLAVHQSGKGAKYTRSHLPVALVYQEELPDKSAALRREYAIKQLSRTEKLRLLSSTQTRRTPMRRKDLDAGTAFAWEIFQNVAYAVLAMTAESGTPYAVPVTIACDGERIYFHGAMSGRKYACLQNSPQVCMTAVGQNHVVEEHFTVQYGSAVAFGHAVELTDTAEKAEALRLICQRHTPHNMGQFQKEISASIDHTAVFRVDVSEITGKQHP